MAIFLACGWFAPAVNSAEADEVVSSPVQDEKPKENEAAESKEKEKDDVDLDALLDLADKAPEQLQSVGIKESASRTRDPESVFAPTESQKSVSNSVGGLLSQSMGVVSRSTSAINNDARIRGFMGSQIVGVANGMNQVKSRPDIDSLFSQIDPNLIDSVHVITGPYSVEFGPGFSFFDAKLISPGRADQLTFNSTTIFGFNSNGGQLN